jgi:hypothetical protein
MLIALMKGCIMQTISHTRFNKEHYKDCKMCYDDHIDFVDQCEIDEQEDARAEQEALDI